MCSGLVEITSDEGLKEPTLLLEGRFLVTRYDTCCVEMFGHGISFTQQLIIKQQVTKGGAQSSSS
jgi:hypothetical protein